MKKNGQSAIATLIKNRKNVSEEDISNVANAFEGLDYNQVSSVVHDGVLNIGELISLFSQIDKQTAKELYTAYGADLDESLGFLNKAVGYVANGTTN